MAKKYKIKGKKAAKKRFSITATGKVRRRKAGLRHLLEHRPADTKRPKRKSVNVRDCDMNKLQLLIPGLSK